MKFFLLRILYKEKSKFQAEKTPKLDISVRLDLSSQPASPFPAAGRAGLGCITHCGHLGQA